MITLKIKIEQLFYANEKRAYLWLLLYLKVPTCATIEYGTVHRKHDVNGKLVIVIVGYR